MKDQVKKWLQEEIIDVFVGYKVLDGHPLPHFYVKEKIEEVDELVTGPTRYPLEKLAVDLVAEDPDMKIGILTRDCNQRALNVLFLWNQLNPDNVKLISVNCCPSRLTDQPQCSLLNPEKIGSYKKKLGISNTMNIEDAKAFTQNERLQRWVYEFEKCIKCYGCRDICPVCFCSECSLEHNNLVRNGELPVETPIFHLVRAVHMAGRCVDCGLCEESCPMDIPLRLLYRMVNEIVVDVFDYKAGIDTDQSPFNILGDKVTLEPKRLDAA